MDFCMVLADNRGSRTIEKQDFLGAIYACSLEYGRICDYWDDWRAFEDTVVRECVLAAARIDWWFRRQEYLRKMAAKARSRGSAFIWKERSTEVAAIHSDAVQLAQPESTGDEPTAPFTLEHVLLAAVRRIDLEIGRELVSTGLDAKRLEEAIRTPRRGAF